MPRARPYSFTFSMAASDDNGVSVSQTPGAAGNLTITGALVTTFAADVDAFATTQTPSGAGNFTLDGVVATTTMTEARHVSFTSDGNESGDTYTITGEDIDGKFATETVTGPNATTVWGNTLFRRVTNVATDGAGTGNITIGTYGIASFDIPRHVLITAAANESARTFTVYGKDRYGDVMTESITGPNATTATGSKNFSQIDRVAIDGAGTGGIEVGTSATADSAPVPLDQYADAITYSVDVTGTLTWDWTYTTDDIFLSTVDESTVKWYQDQGTKTTDLARTTAGPITACRLEITGYNANATAALRVLTASV